MNSTAAIDLPALDTRAPAIDPARAERIAAECFGVEARATRQPSERDANFRMRAADGPGWVLRVARGDEERVALELEMAALAHLARTAPALVVPRVRPSVDGAPLVGLADDQGRPCTARLLTYLPGRVMAETPRTPAQAQALGAALAALDEGLRGFFHPGAGRRLAWNPRCLGELRPYADLIEDAALSARVAAVLAHAEQALLPRLEGLRGQVLHADAGPLNVLVDPVAPERIAGIIDFGDCLHAPRVLEVAVAAADLLPGSEQPLAVACDLLAGYHARSLLEEADLAVLLELMTARIAMTFAVMAWRRRHDAGGEDPLQGYEETARDALERLLAAEPAASLRSFREACAAAGTGEARAHVADGAALVARRRRVLGRHLELSYARPVHVVRAEGVWLHEADGGRCLDAYNNVPHVGHCHPRVVEAVARQAARLNTNTRYLYEIVLDYAERLTATLPSPLSACVLVNSGSEANDVAWRMATAVTGRRGALVMRRAYHGITCAIDELANYDKPDDRIAAHVRTLTAPDSYRGPYRADDPAAVAKYAAEADAAIASLREAGMDVAALMVDPGLCSEGMVEAPPGYLRAVADTVRAAGGLVIADEVQTGFGRLGDAFWGFRAHGVTADLVTMGKPIANGIPLGAVVTRSELLDEFAGRVDFFSTFGGNPVACAAGLAVLDVLADEGLQENARSTGAFLLAGLRELMTRHPLLGDVRGRGLLAGVELVRDRSTLEPAAIERRRVTDAMREAGVLIGADGPNGNVLKIRPPMPFGRAHAERLLAAFDDVLRGLR